MYELISTKQFKKDLKKIIKNGDKKINLLEQIVGMLLNNEKLPKKYRDHSLSGNWIGYRECHITSDWLLIYFINDDNLTLTLTRTGTHSNLFS